MPVEIYDWCNDESLRSQTFRVYEVSSGDEFNVYGESHATAPQPTLAWSASEVVHPSNLTIGADEAFSIRIEKIGTSITSFNIYCPAPFRAKVIATVEDGNLVLEFLDDGGLVPYLYIETNDVRKDMLKLRINAPEEALPVGAISYEQWLEDGVPYIAGDQVVYWSPGATYTLPGATSTTPSLTEIRSGGRAIIRGGAVVRGNFEYHQPLDAEPHDIILEGSGMMSGDYTTPEYVQSLPTFEEHEDFSFIRFTGAPYSSRGCIVRGLTFLRPAHWFQRGYAPNIVEKCTFSNPHYWGIQAFEVTKDSVTGLASCTDCLSLNHDDAFGYWPLTGGHRTDTNCYSVNASGAPWLLGGPPLADVTGRSVTLIDCGCMHLNDEDPTENAPFNRFSCAVARFWMDGLTSEAAYRTVPVTYTRFRVDGPCAVRLVVLENLPYPFGFPINAQDGAGQIADWTFDNLIVEQAPTNTGPLIWIRGLDATSTPHDILFHNCFIAGVPLSLTEASGGSGDIEDVWDGVWLLEEEDGNFPAWEDGVWGIAGAEGSLNEFPYNIDITFSATGVGEAQVPGLGAASGVGTTSGGGFTPVPNSNIMVLAKYRGRYYKVVNAIILDAGDMNELFDDIAVAVIDLFAKQRTQFSRVRRVYDSATGVEVDKLVSERSVLATPPVPYHITEVNGTSVLRSDLRILAPASEFTPDASDEAVYDIQLRL